MPGPVGEFAAGRNAYAPADRRARGHIGREYRQADVAFEQGGLCPIDAGDQGRLFPGAEVFLNEVIKVLEEDEIDKHCDNYKGVLDSCVHKGDCGIRSVIVGLHEVVEHALSQVTLAQLIGSESSVGETFHQIKGINWDLQRGVGLKMSPHTTNPGN
jgi:hypothetical protein